uniref:Uncharacterized protein ycf18 n=1 Tax=Lophocladia kuetzingii TaxID=675577 RepID=A0A1Z1MP30_9FLOR|nr:phycobilisome degradation protein [Lophocladia kuetzingii]ARW67602.1 phycobilisome degradation protein [Lophocladia kuetzingii]
MNYDETVNKLTLEQEFKVAAYQNQINKFNSKDINKYLIVLIKAMIIKDNIIKYCIKHSIM